MSDFLKGFLILISGLIIALYVNFILLTEFESRMEQRALETEFLSCGMIDGCEEYKCRANLYYEGGERYQDYKIKYYQCKEQEEQK